MNSAARLLVASCLSFVSSVFAACAQPQQPPGLPVLGERLRTKPPSSDGECRFDFVGNKEERVFFVLGFLAEYSGRTIIEGDDRVERLPGESEFVALLRRQLAGIATEQGLPGKIREEKDPDGSVTFRSQGIAERINSCYRYQMTNETAVQGPRGYARMANASLKIDLFMKSGHGISRGNGLPDEVFYRRRALAYVAGAWTRYHQGENLVFANAKDKATLIAQLLTSLGCSRVSLESTFGYIPATNTVRFSPTDEVRQWLVRQF